MTIKQTLLLIAHPRTLQTAAEIADHNALKGISLATISSALCKLVKSGEILRLDNFGPRGGYGYVRKW